MRILNRITGAVLWEDATRAALAGADLRSADLRSAYLRSADIRRANLTGAVLWEDATRGTLNGADLRNADLRNADLTGADLNGADLSRADFTGADLTGADLRNADLRRADLTGAYLTGADLCNADLSGAYLRNAYLTGANLTGADLRNADLSGAYLSGAILAGARPAWLPSAYEIRDGKIRRIPTCPQCGERFTTDGADDEENEREQQACGCCAECHSPCERCDECTAGCGACECATCEGCDRRVESVCAACNSCERCCECYRCARCGDVTENSCYHEDDEAIASDHEGYCEDCCRNASTARDGSRRVSSNGRTWPAVALSDRKRFRSQRLAGVEVEYNSCAAFKHIEKWSETWRAEVHSDGSCGWECVTAPAAGDLLTKQITELAKAMDRACATADDSCGVHVHVDARDLRWPDIARLARLWSRVEPAAYILAGEKRTTNEYCLPWGARLTTQLDTSDDAKTALLAAFAQKQGARENLAAQWKAGNAPGKKGACFRYRALNFAPWLARYRIESSKWCDKREAQVWTKKKMANDATVEFRLHEGTLDADELRAWVTLCVRVVEYAASHTDKEVAALPRSGMRALSVIAPECAPWILAKLRAWRRQREHDTVTYHPMVGYTIGNAARATFAADRARAVPPEQEAIRYPQVTMRTDLAELARRIMTEVR